MKGSLDSLSDKELLRLIVDELEGVIVADAEGRYVYVNNRWSSLTGYTLVDVKGKYVREFVPQSRVDYVLHSHKFISGDAILTNKKTGNKIPVYCSYTPLFQGDAISGCLVYMIQKSETTSLDVPSNVSLLMESLDMLLKHLRHPNVKYSLENIVGECPCMLKLKNEIYSAARSSSTVLIEGETGSGKELVAHAIHNLSSRSGFPFIKVNCSAIPSELMEAEFFGYEGGSFTGAQKGGKAGKFEKAYNGSLFLDEINHLPLHIQPKFLRVLQEHEIERIGSACSTPINTRIIAATNIPLSELVERERFRSDLYYRLNVLHIRVPALRERREDIPILANHILSQLNFQLQIQIPYIEDDAMNYLMGYDWPGNVRELRNVIERAMNLSWTEPLQREHFSAYFNHSLAAERDNNPALYQRSEMPFQKNSIREKRASAEKELLIQTLHECGGNKSQAAKQLGVSRTILYKKLHKYDIFTHR